MEKDYYALNDVLSVMGRFYYFIVSQARVIRIFIKSSYFQEKIGLSNIARKYFLAFFLNSKIKKLRHFLCVKIRIRT